MRQWFRFGLRSMRVGHEQVHVSALAINLDRLYIGLMVLLALNLAHIAWFSHLPDTATTAHHVWVHQMLWLHVAMGSSATLLLVAVAWNRRHPPYPRWARWLPDVTGLLVLAFGAALTLADQLVTPSVSAFQTACTAVAAGLLIPPYRALPLLCTVATMTAVWLPRVSQSPVASLQSSQVNVLTAAAVAALVSYLLWRSHTISVRLQLELERTNARLLAQRSEQENLASHDPLTNLYNRRAFEQMVQAELEKAATQHLALAVVMVDLDHFKLVNDRFGHAAGDAVLQHTAQILATGVRNSDTVARFGGEEFVMVLPRADAQGARMLADKLRMALAESVTMWDKQPIVVTASFGIACLPPGAHDTLAHLLQRADEALYLAKTNGRNRVELALN